jgi:transposase
MIFEPLCLKKKSFEKFSQDLNYAINKTRSFMNTTSKVINFGGHCLYIGIDIHKKNWSVSIYSEEFELKTFSQPSSSALLVGYLREHYPGAQYKCVYEAGFSGFGIQRSLAQEGIECMVVHAADVPGSDKETRFKTDRVDSRKLARGLRGRVLCPIHVPEVSQEQERCLIRGRDKIVRDQTRAKNRIKSMLLYFGIDTPTGYKEGQWSQRFIQWLRQVSFSEESARFTLQANVDQLEYLKGQEKIFSKKIMELSQKHQSIITLLCSIPGIGRLSAMRLVSEIGDITRFKTTDQLSSYMGLIPQSHSSGEHQAIGSLTRRGNNFLKTMIIPELSIEKNSNGGH